MPISGKFLGPGKGNMAVSIDRTNGGNGGSGEPHTGGPSSKFIGPTKGNMNVKPDRSSGVKAGPNSKSS